MSISERNIAIDNSKFRDVVESNIRGNEFLRNKLTKGILPKIKIYCIGDVLVGIDLSSGEFHIESEENIVACGSLVSV